jgi:HD-like signal output (HDOD) protein
VDTVHKAVLRIGVAGIRMAVLSLGVVERFGSIAFEHHLNTQLFWEHSIACGLIAAALARELQHKESDSAFTAGLLHDLGRIILAERLGAEYVSVLDAARDAQVPVDIAEMRLLMASHADVIGRLLLSWRFPKELVGPVVYHHAAAEEIRNVAPHQNQEVLRLGLANRLAHALMLGCSGNEIISPTETHCRLLGVRAATIDAIVETARQQTDDTKLALLTGSHGAPWQRPTERYRAELGGPFRPLYISAAPEFDAFRIFCAELAGPETPGAANVAVVHIAAAKDQAALAETLLASERDAGLGALPTIVLSPDGRFALADAALAGRVLTPLATPTQIPRFVRTVRTLLATQGARHAA